MRRAMFRNDGRYRNAGTIQHVNAISNTATSKMNSSQRNASSRNVQSRNPNNNNAPNTRQTARQIERSQTSCVIWRRNVSSLSKIGWFNVAFSIRRYIIFNLYRSVHSVVSNNKMAVANKVLTDSQLQIVADQIGSPGRCCMTVDRDWGRLFQSWSTF